VCTNPRKPKLSDFEVFEDGFIFLCTAKTESECLKKKIFGTILSGWADVRKINQRTAIFLYALGRNPVVHGIFVARSPPFLSYRICEEELPVQLLQSECENQQTMQYQVRTSLFHKFGSLPSRLLNFPEIGLVFHTLRHKSSSQIWKDELAGKYLTKQQTRGIIRAFLKHTREETPPSPPPPPSPISVRAIYKSRSQRKPPIRSGKAIKKGYSERNVKGQNLLKFVKEVDSRKSVHQANGLIRGLQMVAPAKRNGLIMGPHQPAPGKPKGLIMGPHDPFKEVLAPAVHSKNKKRKKHRRKEQSNEMAFSFKGRPSNHVQKKGRRHKINSTKSTDRQATRKWASGKVKNKGRGQLARKQGATIRIMQKSTSKNNAKSGSSGNTRASKNTRASGNIANHRVKGNTKPNGNTRPISGSVRISGNTNPTRNNRPNGNSRSSGNSGAANSRINVNAGPTNSRASGTSRLNVNILPGNNRLNENSVPGNIESNRQRGDWDLCWDFIRGRCRRAQCVWRHEMSANPDYKPPKWVKKSWDKRNNLLSNRWRGRNKYLSLDE